MFAETHLRGRRNGFASSKENCPRFRIVRNLSIHFLKENIKHTLSNKAVVIDAIRIEFIVS